MNTQSSGATTSVPSVISFTNQKTESPLVVKLRRMGRAVALGCVIFSAAARYVANPAHRRSIVSRARWLQRTSRAALRALGIRISAEGELPSAAVIVANHVSYLDILILAAMTPVVFVAKREVRGWPIFGWLARMAGTRFIDREKRGDVSRVGSELAPILLAGASVVLFLEGTSTDGAMVRVFKTSLLEPAVQQNWRVVPAAISYTVPPGHSVAQEVCWWGDMTLMPHLLNLLGVSRVRASVAWDSARVASGNRKSLGAHLHQRVSLLHAALARKP